MLTVQEAVEKFTPLAHKLSNFYSHQFPAYEKEDLFQVALLSIVEKAPQYDSKISKDITFFYNAIQYAILNVVNNKKHKELNKHLTCDIYFKENDSFENLFAVEEDFSFINEEHEHYLLNKYLNKFDEEFRQDIFDHYILEVKLKDLAEKHQVNYSTYLYNFNKQLKQFKNAF